MALAAKNLGRFFRNTGKAREQIFSICKTLTIYIYIQDEGGGGGGGGGVALCCVALCCVVLCCG